jgi:hypothetical protein
MIIAGNSYTIRARVKNDSKTQSGYLSHAALTVVFSVKRDTIVYLSDTRKSVQFAAGQSLDIDQTFTVPSNESGKIFTVRVEVQSPGGSVIASGSVDYQVDAATLTSSPVWAMSNVTAIPSVINPGQTVKFYFWIDNIGAGAPADPDPKLVIDGITYSPSMRYINDGVPETSALIAPGKFLSYVFTVTIGNAGSHNYQIKLNETLAFTGTYIVMTGDVWDGGPIQWGVVKGPNVYRGLAGPLNTWFHMEAYHPDAEVAMHTFYLYVNGILVGEGQTQWMGGYGLNQQQADIYWTAPAEGIYEWQIEEQSGMLGIINRIPQSNGIIITDPYASIWKRRESVTIFARAQYDIYGTSTIKLIAEDGSVAAMTTRETYGKYMSFQWTVPDIIAPGKYILKVTNGSLWGDNGVWVI